MWLLRTCSLLVLATCIYLARYHQGDYAFVLLFLLVLCSVFPITGLTVIDATLTVQQYYAFGWIWKRWSFPKAEQIEVRVFSLESSDNFYTPAGEWWDLFSFLLPRARTKETVYELVHTDMIDNRTNIKLKLSENELRVLEQFTAGAAVAPNAEH